MEGVDDDVKEGKRKGGRGSIKEAGVQLPLVIISWDSASVGPENERTGNKGRKG